MSWIIRWEDRDFNSDDYLVEDLEQIEKSTGTPWSVSNPYREIAVAKAFLAAAMLRLGLSDAEVAEALGKVTLGTLKNAIQYVPDEGEGPSEEPDPSVQRRRSTTRASSRGRSKPASLQALPAESVSATS